MRVEKREENGEKTTVKRKERQQGRNWREKGDKKWVECDECGGSEKRAAAKTC